MHKTIKWSALLGTAAALALGPAACGSDDDGPAGDGAGGEPTKLTFAQPTPESLAFFPYIVAQELGWFEEEGVEVELAPSSEDVPTTTLVANGSADLGVGGGSEVLYAAQQGTELDVVHDYFTKAIEGVVVPEDSDVTGMEQLRGKKIGMASDEERGLIAVALGEVGLSIDDVETVVVGTSGPTLANELQKGSLDAFAGSGLDFAAIEVAGVETREITPPRLSSTPTGALFLTPQTAEERPEAVEAFLRAYVRATELASRDPERVRRIVRERVPEEWQNEPFADALLDATIEATRPGEDGYGILPRAAWEDLEAQMVESGELDAPVGVDDLLNGSFESSPKG